jgi:hypothetical protein
MGRPARPNGSSGLYSADPKRQDAANGAARYGPALVAGASVPLDPEVASVLQPFQGKGWQFREAPDRDPEEFVDFHCPNCRYMRTVICYPKHTTYAPNLRDCLTRHEARCQGGHNQGAQ